MADKDFSSTHPLLPPTSEDDRVFWLRLLRSRRVGVTTFFRLMSEHGSAQVALGHLPFLAKEAGLTDYEPATRESALRELDRGRKLGASLIAYGEPDYPTRLKDISDAPPLLWIKGRQDLLNAPSLSIVGARNASSLGRRMAEALSRDLGAAGYVIISGLARGIDASAHKAALSSGTIAVNAGGVDHIYPSENTQLYNDIIKQGLILSECPIGQTPQTRHFPQRNRIISGMSQATIVIEAASKSGSLITAKTALDQGRDICAVPGHPFDARASGCNHLIRDGATLIRSAEDVIEILRPIANPTHNTQPKLHLDEHPPKQKDKRSRQDTFRLHQQILNCLGPSPVSEDQLIRDLGKNSSQIISVLTELEIEGRIDRLPGGMLTLDTSTSRPQ